MFSVDGELKPDVLSSPNHLNSNRPLSPSSAVQSKVPKITIVKSSADSKREFSVVAMMDKQSSILTKY